MEFIPKQPAPAGPATKSTVDDQQSAGPAPQPDDNRPDTEPDTAQTPAPPPTADPALTPASPTPNPKEADGEEALTDPTTPVQPDTSGDTDPGASSTNDAHPL